MALSLTVNGEAVSALVEPRASLADFLREELRLTGTHLGCEIGRCGACLVLLDEKAVHSCLMYAVQAEGQTIQTIEGLSESGAVANIQKAFHERNAVQCGFCPPGMLITAYEVLKTCQDPSREEIRNALSGNYCRCTGYEAIVDAVQQAARMRTNLAAQTGPGPSNDREEDPRLTPPLTAFDRPNSYIGRSVNRPNAKRLLAGRGRFVTDLLLPRMLHAASFRSPHAHARIIAIETSQAASAPGVRLVATGEDLARLCKPWVGTLDHFKGMKSPPQLPLAVGKVVWAGQPIVAVVAETRAKAEDALELIAVAFEDLEPVTDIDAARAKDAPLVNPELGGNVAFQLKVESGMVDEAFRKAAAVLRTHSYSAATRRSLWSRGPSSRTTIRAKSV